MNTESLKTFITLAHSCNFTRTAQELLVVQSTVSARIKELENELGKKLFLRSGGQVALTPEGRTFLPYAVKIINMEETSIIKINMLAKYTGILSIGVPHTLYDCHIMYYIVDFIKKHPDVSLKVAISHSSEILTNLRECCLDMAVTYSPLYHPKFICEPFLKDKIALVTNKDNKTYKDGVAQQEVLNLPIVFSDFLSASGFEWLLPIQRVYPLDINIVSKVIPILKEGDWYCFLPVKIIQKELEKGELLEIPIIDVQIPEKQSYIIYKKNYKQYPAMVKWLNEVKSNVMV